MISCESRPSKNVMKKTLILNTAKPNGCKSSVVPFRHAICKNLPSATTDHSAVRQPRATRRHSHRGKDEHWKRSEGSGTEVLGEVTHSENLAHSARSGWMHSRQLMDLHRNAAMFCSISSTFSRATELIYTVTSKIQWSQEGCILEMMY